MQAGYVDFVSEQEQAIELAKYLDKVRAVKAQQTGSEAPSTTLLSSCTQLVKDSKFLEVLVNILKESGDLFAAGAEKDVESFFCLFISLLGKLGTDKVVQLQDNILQAITSDLTEKPALRLTILNDLYNSVSHEGWRFAFLKAAFTYGRASKQYHALSVIFDTLEDRLNQQFNQKTTAAQRRELLQLASEIAREGKTENAVAVHLKYLKSFDAEEPSKIPASAVEHAKAVVGDALLNPSVFQFDHLVASNAVKALANGATKPVFELLQIFASQNYDAYAKFVAANKSTIDAMGADADAVLSRKIRLLTVVSVASAATANGSAIIGADGVAVSTSVNAPYSAFSSALQVSEDEVECWVIDAVTAEILDAKLDQLHGSVQISYAMQRTFDSSNWKQLGEKLTAWKENIRGMLKVIHNAREQTLADVVQ